MQDTLFTTVLETMRLTYDRGLTEEELLFIYKLKERLIRFIQERFEECMVDLNFESSESIFKVWRCIIRD